MNKFVHKVQALGNKAAQIKAALESVPPRVAEVREAVAATAGQFQQLRSEVQANVTTLRTDNEGQLIETLREIDGHAATFREAGYELYDVEMELGLPQRLVVNLEKVEDVSHSKIRMLAAANQGNKATHAILTALLKAEELADGVDLTNLTYHKLIVYVGPLPVVRLCWCANTLDEAMAQTSPATMPSTAPPSSAFPTSSIFGASSFFEKRPEAPMTSTVPSIADLPATPLITPTHPTTATTDADRADPLARFKKMPDLSKHRR
ncbi:MAG TPA: hypothetical protein VNT99_13345 [Methylomirabilota bacterium]|nr:hypothetical protein [Methylomirabilota bacterium]